jgi:hypothetical protein
MGHSSEAVIRRRTDKTMAWNWERQTHRKTIVNITLHRKLKIEQMEPH